MICKEDEPFVSCIMPTYNRREFVPLAIKYFLRQDYKNKELIILDDGTDAVSDLIPRVPEIRYYRLDAKISLGAKLNLACQYANGKIIVNWDDDDWYATRRIKYQVETLQNKGTDVCGINNLLYYDLCDGGAYQYIYPADQRTWLLGSSLCYTKEVWNRNRFADINVGMDALFVWGVSSEQVTVLSDTTIAVHMIHKNNVSPKKTEGEWWHTYSAGEVQKIIADDWVFYQNNGLHPALKNNLVSNNQKVYLNNHYKSFKNMYACLVHESEDCVIDLVRNLHYHDPDSIILLYDGSKKSDVIGGRFPYEKFGAVVYAQPTPINYGYLHNFALDCLKFATQNFSFNTITFVDSDQLGIRSGYTEYMGRFFSTKTNIGMLSSLPVRITPENKDGAVWPAVQAFKEFDLWKPFLKKFPDGESKFVHWTFWPSSVFSCDAIKDLIKLFEEDDLLQQIMRQTKIWATEEVIFPTLVKLLGYEILLNPCSYEFVKYRKSYTNDELNNALNKSEAYWIHPIERKYENQLRKQTRQRFHHYFAQKNKNSFNDNSDIDMLTTFSLIDKIKNIEGWLDDKEADLLISLTLKAGKEITSAQAILEIGSYQGKSTVLLGSVVKEHFPNVKVYAIDPHEGTVGAVDQGIYTLSPTLEVFNRNIKEAGLSEVIKVIKDYSYNVKWETPISLMFIDGLHDYPNVARDFWQFSDWVCPNGYVAFHDYSDYYPGVQTFVNELLATGTYRKINKAESLIVVQKL